MDTIRALLTEMKLEAVAHRNDEMLLKANEALSVSEALQVR